MYYSDGINQRTVDLALRSNGPYAADAYSLTSPARTQVGSGTLNTARTLNIVFIGQSTNSNSINGTASPANPTKIFNLSIAHKGACFQSVEPLLVSDLLLGHHGMYLADQLISDGVVDQVVLTMAAIGGSYCAAWNPAGGTMGTAQGISPNPSKGEVAYRLGLTARSIANAGLSGVRTIIDWQQGEWDSDAPATSQTNYAAALNGVVAECKRVGLITSAPNGIMLINQCTRITDATADRNGIRTAQASVPDGVLVRLGGDIDTLGSGDRQSDVTHFTTTGAALQAGLKKAVIENYLANG